MGRLNTIAKVFYLGMLTAAVAAGLYAAGQIFSGVAETLRSAVGK